MSTSDTLRLRQSSPVPRPHYPNGSLQPTSDPIPTENDDLPVSRWSKSPKASSDSGTEADDESTGVLRRLPCPALRPRKGLRPDGDGEEDDGGGPWLPELPPWPSLVIRSTSRGSRRSSGEEADFETSGMRRRRLRTKRRIEMVRRLSETLLLLSVGGVVLLPKDVRTVGRAWSKGTRVLF